MKIKKANKLVASEFKTNSAMRLYRLPAQEASDELARIVIDEVGVNFNAVAICADFETEEVQCFIQIGDNTYTEKIPNIGYIGYHLMRRLMTYGNITSSRMVRYLAKRINDAEFRIAFVIDCDDECTVDNLFLFPDEEVSETMSDSKGWKESQYCI